MASLRNNRQNLRFVIICMVAKMIVMALVITAKLYLLGLYFYHTYSSTGNYDVSGIISKLLYLNSIILIALMVTFIMWFRRAYHNLHLMAPAVPRFTEGWAAGAWFVPFLNLFRPMQIMQDLWRGALRIVPGTCINYPGAIIGSWWAMWLSSYAVNTIFITGHSYMSAPFTYISITAVSQIMSLAALALALWLVRHYGRVELLLEQAALQPEDSIFGVLIANDEA